MIPQACSKKDTLSDGVASLVRRCCLVKKGDWLKVLALPWKGWKGTLPVQEGLTLAKERRITQRQAAQELVFSLSHTKRLLRRLKEAGPSLEGLAGIPAAWVTSTATLAPNRVPEALRDQVTALKRQNRERSNALIADLLREQSFTPPPCAASW